MLLLLNDEYLGNKKKCVFPVNRPTLTFFMPQKKKKIDRQNPEIRLRFRVCFRLQQFSSFPYKYIWSMFGTKNIVLHVK